jgi:thiamine kinase-like enzyme
VEGFLSGIVHRLEPVLGPATGEPVPLSGGITNRNFRITLGEQPYMIRLPGKDTALLGISRDAERIANAAAARLGIAPEVVAAFDDCLVTRFVQCRPATAAELAAAPEHAARALRAFHERGPSLPARFWVPELARSYAAVVAERGGSISPAYEHALEVAWRIAAVRPLTSPAPCHNDLLTANLVVAESKGAADSGLMLVDWEYAGMGDPFFDLGNLSINNDFDEHADRRLLRAYLDREPSGAEDAALELMRAMSDVREAVWGVIQGAISELSFDFAGYAEEHFARLRRTTGGARFKDSLDALAA